MAGQKKRHKSTGASSLLADALAERRKAAQLDEQLQAQAVAAWAKEDAKATARDRRERARQGEQSKREREIAAGHSEAEAVTRAVPGAVGGARDPSGQHAG